MLVVPVELSAAAVTAQNSGVPPDVYVAVAVPVVAPVGTDSVVAPVTAPQPPEALVGVKVTVSPLLVCVTFDTDTLSVVVVPRGTLELAGVIVVTGAGAD
jgi:hypothetical protein